MVCRVVWSSMYLLDGGAERPERFARGAPSAGKSGGEATAVANTATSSPRDRGERSQIFVKRVRCVLGSCTRRRQRPQEQQGLVDDPLLARAVGAFPRGVKRADLTN